MQQECAPLPPTSFLGVVAGFGGVLAHSTPIEAGLSSASLTSPRRDAQQSAALTGIECEEVVSDDDGSNASGGAFLTLFPVLPRRSGGFGL